MDGNFNNQNTNGQGYQQPGYQQPGYQTPYQPMGFQPLKTNRGLWKTILLNLVTCGIYGIIFYSSVGENINQIASRRDGKNTLHYCLVYFLLGPITCEIFSIVWLHSLSNRIGDEARARGIATDFGASTYWLWNVLGSLIIVGPFIYLHKLCKTMNALCENYNRMGI